MIGKVIGDYRIVRKLGEGGMGAVYVGVDTMLDREVAIKALRPALASQPEIIERFLSEAKTLARLNHPNVATLYCFVRHEGEYFMVIEFVRGRTFQAILVQRGAVPCREAVQLFCQVLDGIAHAHRLGIIHRDIKPSNLMLTEDGTLKVLDFGIARILWSERLTKAGQLAGTIEYMAPEQVLGKDVDERTDIYSLGMLLYQMLTGRAPFAILNEYELMKAQIEQMPTPPRELNPSIPEEVERAIMRAVAKNPDERFQTAAEFRTALLGVNFERAASTAVGAGEQSAPTSFATRPSNPSFDTAQLQESHAATKLMGEEAPGGTKVEVDSSDTSPARANRTRIGPHRAATGAPTTASSVTRLSAPSPVVAQVDEQPSSNPADGRRPETVTPAASGRKWSWPHYAAAAVFVLLVSGLLVVAWERISSSVKTPAPGQQPPVASQPTEPAERTDAPPPAAAAESAPQADAGPPGAAPEAAPAAAAATAQAVNTEPKTDEAAPDTPAEVAAEPPAPPSVDGSKGQPKAAPGTQQRDRARARKSEPLSRREDLKKALTRVP